MNKTNLLLVIIFLSAAFFCAATGVASAISLSDKYVGNTVVDLEWSEWPELPDGFSQYGLCRNESLIHLEFSRSNTSYRDEGLSKGNKYNYEIKVYNASGGLVDTSTKKTVTAGEVHGTITLSTTWTLATSPYNLIDHVEVREGARLTISPGVTVKSDSIHLGGIFVRVNGTHSSESVAFDTVPIGGTWIGGRYLVRDCLLYNGSSLYFMGSDSSVIGNTLTDGSISANGNNNTIKGNTLTDGNIRANGNNNTIKGNTLTDGDIRANGNNNTIKYNILNNTRGISLNECNYNIVAGNTLSGGGISLFYAYHNTIAENNVSNASSNGIHIEGASYNTVAGNIISNSGYYGSYCGIHIRGSVSDNNIIKDNIISNSSYYGIRVDGNYNAIYNNYFDNEDNDCDQGWSNIWNITKTPGTNIVGGPYLGGNYWSDYSGTDADDDGFGDTPYEIDGTFAKDYLPLVKFSSPQPVWNVDTGERFEKIQEAIGDPDTQDGHTIRVYEGTYTENVKVNKSLTIRSRGGREVTIVQAKDTNDYVFHVMKDSTTIEGFTVKGATGKGKAGIYIHGSTVSDCKVANNTAESNHYGVYLDGAVECNGIENNTITHNSEHGIFLKECKHITISNNTLENNYANGHGMYLLESTYNQILDNEIHVSKYDGINLNNSDDNEITNNTVLSNWENGIVLFNSTRNDILENTVNSNYKCGIVLNSASGNNITNNTATENKESGFSIKRESKDNIFVNNTALKNYQHGIEIHSSNNNTLASNNANSNTWYGISLCYLSDNTLTSNNVSSNQRGIWLCHSSDNTLADNNVNSNYDYGIFLEFSSKNTILNNTVTLNENGGIFLSVSSNNNIHNNHFNNTNNAYDDGNNVWNIAKAPGTNIVGGPYLGGNYWSDYKGEDKDGDYLGDTLLPYNATGSIQTGGDEHPLIIPIDLSIESKDIVAPDKVEVDTVPAYGEVQIVEIEATIHNNGIYDVSSVDAKLNIKFRDKTTLAQKETINKIAAGSSATVVFKWEVLKWVKDNLENLWAEDQGGTPFSLKAPVDVEQRPNFVYVEVVVDPENKILESDETNNAALAESEKTLLLVIPDVKITLIKPIQVIELDSPYLPDLPLIYNKPMMTRVWVELKDGELFAEAHNVRVKVEFDDGNPAQELEMCLINHREGGKYVTYVVPEDQVAAFKKVMENPDKLKNWLFRHGSQAFNFEFDGRNPRPVGNKLVITASLQNSDSDENNNILKSPAANVKPTTLDDNRLDILYKPVDSLHTSHERSVAQHKRLMKKHAAFIEATYPVAEVRAFYSDDQAEQYLPPKDPYTMVSFCSPEKTRMVKKGSYYCDYGGFDRVVWVVPYQALGVGTEGEARPLAGRGVFVDERAKLHLSAHEIGHTYGLAGLWGYKEEYDDDHNAFYVADNGWDVKGEASRWMMERTKRPKYSYDLGKYEVMSNFNYQTFMGNPLVDQPWITIWNYQRLMDKLVSGGSDPRLLLVSGEIYEDDSVEFDPFFEVEEVPDEVPSGDYFFECIAGNGTVLSSTSYDPSYETHNGTSYFGFTIVYPEGTAKVVLRHNDTLLKEVVISPSAPVIVIDSVEDLGNENYEVTWIGTDADGDDLEYLFFFSSDGELWFLLEDELTEDAPTCTLKFNSLSMAGGNESWVKIVATDGVNTVEALSEPFSVPTKPPSASIISPRDGSVFNQEDEIDFDGFGYDRDIGLLNGSTFVWTSSIDGEIGRGDYFTLSNLSLGGHQITITVTDSEGKTANASVNITIVKIVINEVYPYPGAVQDAKEEWIEFYNDGEVDLNLTGWRIVNGDDELDYSIPANSSDWDGILESDSYLVLHLGGTLDTHVEDLCAGIAYGVLGNEDDSVSLLSDDNIGVDFVRYGNWTDDPPTGTSWTGVNPDAPVPG